MKFHQNSLHIRFVCECVYSVEIVNGFFFHIEIFQACKSSPEEIQEQIERLQSAVWTRWFPCDQFLRLGGVTLLLQIVAFSYDWNFNGR